MSVQSIMEDVLMFAPTVTAVMSAHAGMGTI